MSWLLDKQFSQDQKILLDHIQSNVREIGRSISQYRSAVFALAILLVFIFSSLFAPIITPYDPSEPSVAVLESPSVEHPFGTDHHGQDVFSQWLYGARISLLVGFISGISVAVIGTSVGLLSGYYKGTVDLVLMRLVDIMYAIPPTPLILIIALTFGSSLWNVVLAMVAILWRDTARLIRSQTLSHADRPYVKAAKATGASDLRIIYFHIAPNLLPLIFVNVTLVIGYSIVLEAGISFLGLSSGQSWGSMLQLTFTTGAIQHAWWWVIPPGLSISLLVTSFFYISRAVEDMTSPQLKY